MENEIWKDIEGFEGYYQVSNFGNVRSVDRMVQHWRGGLSKVKCKLLRPRLGTNGYFGVQLCKNNKAVPREIHRLVAKYFILNPENKREVNHIDGDKANNHYLNLEWRTPKENQHHARTTGLINDCGENNTRSVLTNQQAREIRALKGISQYRIAEIYGVSQTTISRIILNKSYKNIMNNKTYKNA